MKLMRLKFVAMFFILIISHLILGCGDDSNPVSTGNPNPIRTVYLDFDINDLDLDTGIIDTVEWFDPMGPTFDVFVQRSEDQERWHTIFVINKRVSFFE